MAHIKLKPAFKNYLWGGQKLNKLFGLENGGKNIAESWAVSVHPSGESRVSGGGTLADYLRARPFAVSPAGGELPVLIKYIDAAQKLSVQVHPDDEYAYTYEGECGKTEMWYVISAESGSGIYCGFNRDVSREEFLQAVKSGAVESLLNFIPVKKGDCRFIPAGTVHAICAGCVICEVQQNSNLTYRVYDYGRRDAAGNFRELHIEKAAAVINYSKFPNIPYAVPEQAVTGGRIRYLTECEHFNCRELSLCGKFSERAETSFRALCVIEGNGEIDGNKFKSGDAFFVPCGEEFVLSGNAKIIITDVKGVNKWNIT